MKIYLYNTISSNDALLHHIVKPISSTKKKDFQYCASPRYIFIIIYWVCRIDVACLLISEELENHTLITNDAR